MGAVCLSQKDHEVSVFDPIYDAYRLRSIAKLFHQFFRMLSITDPLGLAHMHPKLHDSAEGVEFSVRTPCERCKVTSEIGQSKISELVKIIVRLKLKLMIAMLDFI